MKALSTLAGFIDRLNEGLGRMVSWLTLFMVLMQFAIVVFHYIFREGSIFLQESLLYMHSMIFLAGAAYTLKHNGHVRVDVIYSRLSDKAKAWVNLVGSVIFLFPVLGVIGWMAWPYVFNSWQILEGSIETSGIQAVYLLKSMIILFVVSMALQAVSLMCHALLTIRDKEQASSEEAELI